MNKRRGNFDFKIRSYTNEKCGPKIYLKKSKSRLDIWEVAGGGGGGGEERETEREIERERLKDITPIAVLKDKKL